MLLGTEQYTGLIRSCFLEVWDVLIENIFVHAMAAVNLLIRDPRLNLFICKVSLFIGSGTWIHVQFLNLEDLLLRNDSI